MMYGSRNHKLETHLLRVILGSILSQPDPMVILKRLSKRQLEEKKKSRCIQHKVLRITGYKNPIVGCPGLSLLLN